jgi:membrane protein involved in colicin uptake
MKLISKRMLSTVLSIIIFLIVIVFVSEDSEKEINTTGNDSSVFDAPD